MEGEFLFLLRVRCSQSAGVSDGSAPKLSKAIGQTNRLNTLVIITVGFFGEH